MEKNQRILVPLDGSRCGENILPKVEDLASSLKAGICLLRVTSAHPFPGADRTEAEVKVVREAEEYLKSLEDQLKAKGFDVDRHVRYGNEAKEILDHASQREIDLIAMSRRHGGVKHFLLGCVTEKVVRRAAKPLFTVPC